MIWEWMIGEKLKGTCCLTEACKHIEVLLLSLYQVGGHRHHLATNQLHPAPFQVKPTNTIEGAHGGWQDVGQ